jgi:hypothetical protein
MRKLSTTEALMTDPTTPEGDAYWQERRDYEEALERMRDKLTAAEYREALRLVLEVLRDRPTDRLEAAEMLGRLQSHIQTIVGEWPSMEPIYGLRALRRERERLEGASEEVTPDEQP